MLSNYKNATQAAKITKDDVLFKKKRGKNSNVFSDSGVGLNLHQILSIENV